MIFTFEVRQRSSRLIPGRYKAMKEIRIDTDFFGNAIEFSTSIRELRIFLLETEKFFEERKKTLEPENEYYEDLDEELLY